MRISTWSSSFPVPAVPRPCWWLQGFGFQGLGYTGFPTYAISLSPRHRRIFKCLIFPEQGGTIWFSRIPWSSSASLYQPIPSPTDTTILKMASRLQLPLRFAQLASPMVVLGLSIYGRFPFRNRLFDKGNEMKNSLPPKLSNPLFLPRLKSTSWYPSHDFRRSWLYILNLSTNSLQTASISFINISFET